MQKAPPNAGRFLQRLAKLLVRETSSRCSFDHDLGLDKTIAELVRQRFGEFMIAGSVITYDYDHTH